MRRVSTGKDSATYGCDSYPLHVPPKPWHTIGLDYLTHLHVSNGFDIVLIVVDHPARMAHFLPCTESIIVDEIVNLFFYMESTACMDYPA
jgi:hypothetical protein